MPIAIISSTFLRIAQHFVCFIDLNKASFRSLFFVGVRVILLGQTTKCFFQFVFARASRYTKYLIIISFVTGHQLVLYLPTLTGCLLICAPKCSTGLLYVL